MMERQRFGRGGGNFRSTAPVKVGDELTVKIEAVGEKGDGVAKKDGFVLFVPGVQEGQTVKIRVTKVLKKLGFAEVIGEGSPEDVDEESPAEEAEEDMSESEPEEESEPAEDSEDFGEEEPEE